MYLRLEDLWRDRRSQASLPSSSGHNTGRSYILLADLASPDNLMEPFSRLIAMLTEADRYEGFPPPPLPIKKRPFLLMECQSEQFMKGPSDPPISSLRLFLIVIAFLHFYYRSHTHTMAPTIVLHSGANRGLGKGILKLYLVKANHVVIAANRDTEQATSKELLALPTSPGSRFAMVKVDASIEADPFEAIKTLATQGIDHLDLVIANAGVAKVVVSRYVVFSSKVFHEPQEMVSSSSIISTLLSLGKYC